MVSQSCSTAFLARAEWLLSVLDWQGKSKGADIEIKIKSKHVDLYTTNCIRKTKLSLHSIETVRID